MPDVPVTARPQMVPDGPFQRRPPRQPARPQLPLAEHEPDRFVVRGLSRLVRDPEAFLEADNVESAPRYRFSCRSSIQE